MMTKELVKPNSSVRQWLRLGPLGAREPLLAESPACSVRELLMGMEMGSDPTSMPIAVDSGALPSGVANVRTIAEQDGHRTLVRIGSRM